MNNNGTIAILRKNGSVDQIYCHTEADISNCGIYLYLYYVTEDAINSLINLNAILKLGACVNLDPIHYIDSDETSSNITIKLECSKDVEYEHYPTVNDFLSERIKGSYNYLYNLKKHKWFLVLEDNEMSDLSLVISKYCKDGLIKGEIKDEFILKTNDEEKTKIYQMLNNKMMDDLGTI